MRREEMLSPLSPLAWNAARRCLLAGAAVFGLWGAVGWALGWWAA